MATFRHGLQPKARQTMVGRSSKRYQEPHNDRFPPLRLDIPANK